MTALSDVLRQELQRSDERVARLETRMSNINAELMEIHLALQAELKMRAELRALLGPAREEEPTTAPTPVPPPATPQPQPGPRIGDVIKAAREGKGVLPTHLAKTMGISQSYLSSIEKGLARPSFRVRRLLSQHLGLDYEELCKIDPPSKNRWMRDVA